MKITTEQAKHLKEILSMEADIAQHLFWALDHYQRGYYVLAMEQQFRAMQLRDELSEYKLKNMGIDLVAPKFHLLGCL